MTHVHEAALEVVRALHAMGATQVKVGDIEAKFDRVLVPLDQAAFESEPGEFEALRERLEIAQEQLRAATALGVI
jgi:hypothetical protein